MTAAVENIRQQIDRLAPDEVRELLEDLKLDHSMWSAHTEHSASRVEELSAADQAKLAALRHDIQIAADQLDRGEGIEIDWDEFLAERHRAYDARQQKA